MVVAGEDGSVAVKASLVSMGGGTIRVRVEAPGGAVAEAMLPVSAGKPAVSATGP